MRPITGAIWGLVFITGGFSLPASGEKIIPFFKCLETQGATTVSAHRGGPAPGYPENAIETMARGRQKGVRLFEIDVVQASDGTLYLMHDRNLDRTTTGSGPVGSLNWAELSTLKLEDNDGNLTDFAIPRLSDALDWAFSSNSFLTLDVKPSTPLSRLADVVNESKAADRLLLLPGGDLERAKEAQSLFPKSIISVSLSERQSLDAIGAAGLDKERLILWTGFRRFNPKEISILDDKGYYVSFGTLGFGDSYDDRIAASGDYSLYADFARSGLHMIATDAPLSVRLGLAAEGQAWDSNKNQLCD